MSDPVHDPPASANGPGPVAPPARQFCGGCGAPWQQHWQTCPRCLDRTVRSARDVLSTDRERTALRRVFLLYGALLLVSVVTIIVTTVQGHELDLAGQTVQTVVFSLLILVPALFSRALLPLVTHTGRVRWLLLAPAAAVGTFAVAAVIIKVLTAVIGLEEVRYLDTFRAAGYGLGVATLYVAVQPAICEEIAFRGLMMNSLSVLLSPTEAVLVSAGLFAILHLSVLSLPHLLLLGVAVGWLRVKSNSLYPGMLLHFTHNFLCLLAEHVGGPAHGR